MQPPHAFLRDGKLVLEVDQQQFIADATRGFRAPLQVSDPEQFWAFVLQHVFTLSHDVDESGAHPSWWMRFSEALGRAAASAGAGVREFARIEPTCGCDPEEHDGG